MMYELEIFEGHPIIRDGENVILIDTGSPVTIHKERQLHFRHGTFDCETNYMGLTVASLSEMLGTQVTTLLGTNILSLSKVYFNYKEKQFGYTGGVVGSFKGKDISSIMGIPVIEIEINGQRHRVFLDTGARLSYLLNEYTGDFESCGMEQDFYPGIGPFSTPRYTINTVFEGHVFPANYGNLPSMLANTLKYAGVTGILGYDFFSRFKVVLDLSSGHMSYAAND